MDLVRKVFEQEETRFIQWLRHRKLSLAVLVVVIGVCVAYLYLYRKYPYLLATIRRSLASSSVPLWAGFLLLLWLLLLTYYLHTVLRSLRGTAIAPCEPVELEQLTVADQVSRQIPRLTETALNILEAALEAYDPSSSQKAAIRLRVAVDGDEDSSSSVQKSRARTARACEELELEGMISEWDALPGGRGTSIKLTLHHRLRSLSKSKMLKWVQDEIVARHVSRLPY